MEQRVDRLERRVDVQERRLDEHGGRLDELEREERRTRKRLHDLESDRHAVGLATRAVTELAAKVGKSHDNLDEIAEGAAQRAIDKDRARRRESLWKIAVRVATILGGLGGIGYLVAYLILSN